MQGMLVRQFNGEEALALGCEGLGAIDDPFLLVETATIDALAVRNMVGIGQLNVFFPGRDMPADFRLVEHNLVVLPWPFEVP